MRSSDFRIKSLIGLPTPGGVIVQSFLTSMLEVFLLRFGSAAYRYAHERANRLESVVVSVYGGLFQNLSNCRVQLWLRPHKVNQMVSGSTGRCGLFGCRFTH